MWMFIEPLSRSDVQPGLGTTGTAPTGGLCQELSLCISGPQTLVTTRSPGELGQTQVAGLLQSF